MFQREFRVINLPIGMKKWKLVSLVLTGTIILSFSLLVSAHCSKNRQIIYPEIFAPGFINSGGWFIDHKGQIYGYLPSGSGSYIWPSITSISGEAVTEVVEEEEAAVAVAVAVEVEEVAEEEAAIVVAVEIDPDHSLGHDLNLSLTTLIIVEAVTITLTMAVAIGKAATPVALISGRSQTIVSAPTPSNSHAFA